MVNFAEFLLYVIAYDVLHLEQPLQIVLGIFYGRVLIFRLCHFNG